MPFDASYQPPQPFIAPPPRDSGDSLLTMRNAMLEGQTLKQQQELNALNIAEKKREADEIRATNEAYKGSLVTRPDGSVDIDMNKLGGNLANSGHGSKVPGILEGITKYKTANATLAKTQSEVQELQGKIKVQEGDAAGAMAASVAASGDDPHVFLTMARLGSASKTMDPAVMEPLVSHVEQLLQQDPSGESARAVVAQARTRLQAASAEQQKQIAAKQTAQARADTASAVTQKLPYELRNLQATGEEKGLAIAGQTIDTVANQGQYDAWRSQQPADVQKTLPAMFSPAAVEIIKRQALTSDQQRQADQAKATLEETKKRDANTKTNEDAHLKIAQEDLELKRKTFNLNQDNSKNLGLQGVPPHLIGPATAAYEKAGLEFATASSAADTMQSVLDLAEKGNKAAGSNLPLVGVETLNAINGIKRINGAEIAQYGSAGSLLDQLKGKLGKLTAGQPIPQDVLDDIRALHTEIAKQAGTTYERKVQTTNKTYGSQFKPVEFAPAKAAAAPAHVIDVGGKRYQYNGTGDTADLKNYTEVKKQQ